MIAISLQIVKLTGMCAGSLELWMRGEIQEKKLTSLSPSGTSGRYYKGIDS